MDALIKKQAELQSTYNQLLALTTQYGLNNFGDAVHTQLEASLRTVRQEFSSIDELIQTARSRNHELATREQELRQERELHERG